VQHLQVHDCLRTPCVLRLPLRVRSYLRSTHLGRLLLLLLRAGRIGKIRLLGDLQHSTRIAFIEFIDAEAAMAALNCSGALLGELL
jgi:hypothetical protein